MCEQVHDYKEISKPLIQIFSPTCSDNGSIIHEDHHVSFLHKFNAMSAKDSGLSPEQLHDTFLHEMFGHVGVDSCQRIIKEVEFFVLRSDRNLKINVTSHTGRKDLQNIS